MRERGETNKTEIHTERTGVQEQNNCNQQVNYKDREFAESKKALHTVTYQELNANKLLVSSLSSRNCQMHDI